LYGLEDDVLAAMNSKTPRPYLNITVRSPHHSGVQSIVISLPPTIRNAILFPLGVILLELPFKKPLEEYEDG
jgi:hypothetical protein